VTGAVRIGCSGWNYKHWRVVVYPERLPPRRWLAHYATLLDTVELNATFYRLPSRAAVASWVEGTPPEFVFAVKASRYLTHVKRLRDLTDGVARFRERLEPMIRSPKLGPILWQLPERFHRDDDRLAESLALLPPGRHAFEFRHPSWFTAGVYRLLREHRVALVVGDHPKRAFQTLETTADWTYVRFHYGRRGRDGNYSAAELGGWADRIVDWRRSGDVFAYFNNDWHAFAVENALALRAAVTSRIPTRPSSGRLPGAPPLPHGP
jgi:uncharacterized protein YecE (DUF72 family)